MPKDTPRSKPPKEAGEGGDEFLADQAWVQSFLVQQFLALTDSETGADRG